ncbi:MAG: hypothetical protein HYZ53_29705 [Planctomycetes bacterium]|nr:hypothetical protein [Planctomycetota bacterium]
MLALAALFFLLLLPRLGAAAEPAPELDVDAGFGGVCVDGRWASVRVRVKNAGADLAGTLRLLVRTPTEDLGAYEEAVKLPRGSTKSFELPVLSRGAPALAVELRDGRGRVVASRVVSLRHAAAKGLLVVLGASWLGLEGLAVGTGDASRAVLVSPERAPRRALGYDAVECVFVDDAAPAGALDPSAAEALVAWVRGGGRLVLSWKDLAARRIPGLLPAAEAVVWKRTVADAQAWRELLPGVEAPVEEVALAAGRLPGAHPLWRSEAAATGVAAGGAWVQALPVGLGEVVVTGFSATESPLRVWKGLPALWAALLELELQAGVGAGATPGAGPSAASLAPRECPAEALEDLRVGYSPERWPLAVLLLVQPLFVGAGYALWLRRARGAGAPTRPDAPRSRRSRVPVLVVVLLAGALAGGGSALLAGAGAPSVRRVSMVRGMHGAALSWRGTTVAAVCLPAGGQLDLTLDDPGGGLAGDGRGASLWRRPSRRFGFEQDVVVRSGQGARMDAVRLSRSDVLTVRADWSGREPSTSGLRIITEKDGLRFANEGARPLRDLRYWDGNRLWARLGALGPGEIWRPEDGRIVAETSVVGDRRAAAGRARWLREQGLRVGSSPSNPASAALSAVLTALWDRPTPIPPGDAVLWYVAETDPGGLRVLGASVEPTDLTLVELHLAPR